MSITVTAMIFFHIMTLIWWSMIAGVGGDSHIKVIVMLVLWLSGVNFRFWFLLGLRVFGTESHYICPFRDHLGLCKKKFTRNAITLTPQKSNC